MRKHSGLAAVLLAAMFAMPANANTINISGTFSGSGTGGTPPVFTESFSGTGVDNTFGSFSVSEQATVDVTNPSNYVLTGGTFNFLFSQGSLVGTFTGSGAPGSVAISFLIQSGFLAGDTGSGSGTGAFTATGFEGNYEATINTTGTLVLDPKIPGPNGPYSDLIAPPVPEASTWAMMIIGFAGLGVVAYRRRRNVDANCSARLVRSIG